MKRIEMIGRPLDHVRTPDLLNALLTADGSHLRVVRRELAPEGLAAYAEASQGDPGLVGMVVTTPLKEAICDRLARTTALVALIGSCNCIRQYHGAWTGANFDGFGFARALAERGLSLAGKRVLLLGCGGAGKAIAERVLGEGASALHIRDSVPGKAAAFAARLGSPIVTEGTDDEQGPWDMIVNASTLGMGEGDPSPVPATVVAGCGAIVDIVISARESALKRLAREHGKPVVEGAAMVGGQIALFRAFLLSDAQSESDAMEIAARPSPAERGS